MTGRYIQLCMLMFTVLVPPTGLNTECSLATNYTMVDVLVCPYSDIVLTLVTSFFF